MKKLNEYNFWKNYEKDCGVAKCPMCGGKMAVKKFNVTVQGSSGIFFCESCPFCTDIHDKDLKIIKGGKK